MCAMPAAIPQELIRYRVFSLAQKRRDAAGRVSLCTSGGVCLANGGKVRNSVITGNTGNLLGKGRRNMFYHIMCKYKYYSQFQFNNICCMD